MEIAPDVYRISTYVPEANLQFNQFLVKDDEPFLYPKGTRGLFPFVCEALARILKPESIRWLGFSHFELDECGALNEWLMIAPNAQTVCSQVGALVNLNDFAKRDRCWLDNFVGALAIGYLVATGQHYPTDLGAHFVISVYVLRKEKQGGLGGFDIVRPKNVVMRKKKRSRPPIHRA